ARSAGRSSPSCLGTGCLSARTGLPCHERGPRASMSASASWSDCGQDSPNASAAAACRWIAAGSPIRAIAPRAAAPALVIGSRDLLAPLYRGLHRGANPPGDAVSVDDAGIAMSVRLVFRLALRGRSRGKRSSVGPVDIVDPQIQG